MSILFKWRGHMSIFKRLHHTTNSRKAWIERFVSCYTILRPVYFHRMGTKRANEKANESFVYTAKTEHVVP